VSEKKKDDRHVPRSGAIVPEDTTTGDLATWLHKMWARDNPPERIEVWQVFNPHKSVRGERVYAEDYKPHDKKDQEQCVKIANEIVGTAQDDCNCVRREQDYLIVVFDRNRSAGPTVRRLGPLFPKITYLSQQKGKDHLREYGDDDFDQPHNWRSMQLKEIELSHERIRWGEQRNDRVLGETLGLFRDTVLEQRAWLSGLMAQQMQFFKELQEAKNEETDRMIARKKAEITTTLMEEGLRTARAMLPMLFKDAPTAPQLSPGPAPASPDYGLSEERTLVGNLLEDCEKTKFSVQLFGDWEVKDGVPTQIKPGIFSQKQFAVLYGVANGKLPANALDALIPDSGHQLAVTVEQLTQAEAAGIPQSIDMQVKVIFGLRLSKRAQATQTTTAAPEAGKAVS
jgi:hypothetical protein